MANTAMFAAMRRSCSDLMSSQGPIVILSNPLTLLINLSKGLLRK